jgi:hypothetical protein
MGNLGVVHPILATAIRAERATLRAARAFERRKIEQDPASADLDDSLALGPSDLESLIGRHRAAYRKIDWGEQAQVEPVPLPVRAHERERAARHALATWKFSWFDRLFGNEALRRRQLNAKMIDAARDDEVAYQAAYRAAAAHNAEVLGVRRLFELDPKAIKDAVAAKTRLAELREPMNRLGVVLPGGRRLVAFVEAIHEEDIPYVRLVEAGRCEMIPAGERRRIHLAALCSAGLRVGAELVALLPLDAVEVAVAVELSSGRLEPVLQMLVTAQALAELPWARADAVSLARGLGARMDWSLEAGFSPIQLVDLTPRPALAV